VSGKLATVIAGDGVSGEGEKNKIVLLGKRVHRGGTQTEISAKKGTRSGSLEGVVFADVRGGKNKKKRLSAGRGRKNPCSEVGVDQAEH